MKAVFRFCSGVVKDLLKKELGSVAGKVNLIGGIIGAVGGIVVFAENLTGKIISMVLVMFDKPPLPTFPNFYILLYLIGLLVYFYACTKLIASESLR